MFHRAEGNIEKLGSRKPSMMPIKEKGPKRRGEEEGRGGGLGGL